MMPRRLTLNSSFFSTNSWHAASPAPQMAAEVTALVARGAVVQQLVVARPQASLGRVGGHGAGGAAHEGAAVSREVVTRRRLLDV